MSFTPEQVVSLTKLGILKDNPYIGLESIVVYICNNGISFDDLEAIEKIRMQDVLTEVDNEFGQKSFLCLRVFSKKQEELIQFRTLENLAQAGKLLPTPSQATAYLPNPCPEAKPFESSGRTRERELLTTDISSPKMVQQTGESLEQKLRMLEDQMKRAGEEAEFFKRECSRYKNQGYEQER